MKQVVFIYYIFFFVFAKWSWSAENFVKTYVENNNFFYVTGMQDGLWIEVSNFQIFLFQEAYQSCQLTPDLIKSKILNYEKKLWQTLNRYYPHADEEFKFLNIRISIDSFGSKSEKPEFGSYFIPKSAPFSFNLIVMDCHYFNGNYWLSFLGHEIIHALLSEKVIPSWAEELLAQTVEYEMSLIWPAQRVKSLNEKVVVPSPITTERPFLSSARYASNFYLDVIL